MPSRKRKSEGNCMWCDRRTTRGKADNKGVLHFICVACTADDGHCFEATVDGR